jgi:carbamoyltransferase
MRDRINSLVKKREGFRPFAPVVTSESARQFFAIAPGEEESFAHMLYVTHVHPAYREKLPAVTHVDGSARVQTVSAEHNPRLWQLLKAFEAVAGLPMLLNTSFNVKGEPIVCTPEEAINSFSNARLDLLVMGDYLVEHRPISSPGQRKGSSGLEFGREESHPEMVSAKLPTRDGNGGRVPIPLGATES